VIEVRAANRSVTSLDTPVGDGDGDTTLGELIPHDDGGPEESAEDAVRREAVQAALAALPERERNVIELRFGTGDEAPQSLAQAGKRLGITRQRTQQLEAQALKRLANRPELAALRDAA
jgi:RNA polymerase primary sigma factor